MINQYHYNMAESLLDEASTLTTEADGLAAYCERLRVEWIRVRVANLAARAQAHALLATGNH